MLDKKALEEGKVYQVSVTGMVRDVLAVAEGRDERYGQAMVRVLNEGMLKDTVLKREDYIPVLLFGDSVTDPKVVEALRQPR